MVKEAEHYAEQDKKLRSKLNAKTAYEGYMSSARSTLGTGVTREYEHAPPLG